MPSNYTGNSGNGFSATLPMVIDGDRPAAQLWRVPEQALLDNDCYLKAQADLSTTSDLAAFGVRALDLSQMYQTVALTDSANFMAAVNKAYDNPAAPILLIKAGSGDNFDATRDDMGLFNEAGTVASITSHVVDAAVAGSGGRIVAIGTGGNLNTYSATGSTWSAGGTGIGGAVEYIVYSPPNSLAGGGAKFFTAGSGGGNVYKSPDASTAWTSVTSGFSVVSGLAVIGGVTSAKGYVVALGASGGKPRFSLLTDGGNGGNFSGSVAPPNAATADSVGSLCGAPYIAAGAKVYHAMSCDTGARIRTASSVDGTTWVAGTTLESSAFGAFTTGSPKLMVCKSTGLFVLITGVTSGAMAAYASKDFVTWSGPRFLNSFGGSLSLTGFAVAGGRLFATRGTLFLASQGVGAEL